VVLPFREKALGAGPPLGSRVPSRPTPTIGGIRRPWKKQQLDGFCPLLIARAIEPPIGVLHGLQPPRIGAPVTQRSAKPDAPFPVILHKANNDGHYYTVSANFRALL
jgi:hypothetical protein